MLVWIAISDQGISDPYFVPSSLSINLKICVEEYIKKRLLAFIDLHHSDAKFLFWPDLASSHYAKTVVAF